MPEAVSGSQSSNFAIRHGSLVLKAQYEAMAEPRINTERLGQPILIYVEVYGFETRFPPCCPCCLEPVSKGAVLRIRIRDGRREVKLPACGHILWHAGIADSMIILIVTSVITGTLGYVFFHFGWRTLLKVFRSPICGISAMLVMGVIGVVLVVLSGHTLKLLFRKRTCTDLTGGADVKESAHGLVFTFESPEYARRFAQVNGNVSGLVPEKPFSEKVALVRLSVGLFLL